MLFGQVTDFIIRSGGILNVADQAIEIGMVLLIIFGIVSWLKSKCYCKNELNKKTENPLEEFSVFLKRILPS
ncbi:hypothetical protein [Pseudoneobacillus sp. C159]